MCANRAGALFTFMLGRRRVLNFKGRSNEGFGGGGEWGCSFAGVKLK